MNPLGISPQNYLGSLMGMTGVKFSEEQKEVIYNFNKSGIVWADPGTGKTHTVVAGLLMAEQIFQMNPNKIIAMSYTRPATAELKNRHFKMCRSIGISQNVVFKTIHAYARQIILDYGYMIGIKEPKIVESLPFYEQVKEHTVVSEDFGLEIPLQKIRRFVVALNTLNSSLIFDDKHIKTRFNYISTGIDIEIFNFMRRRAYFKRKRSGKIPRGETCLYALEILLKCPEISEKFKKEIDLMVIDESQDMSILQLKLASLLTEKLIIVGDLKQQIYGYNGACPEIVKEYRKLYPEADEYELTKSFRCGEAIAKFATNIILPNEIGGENFKGVDKKSNVTVSNEISFRDIVSDLKKELLNNNNVAQHSVMFLYRNNFSAVPIIQYLYEKQVPAIIDKYISILSLPVIEEIMGLLKLASNMRDRDNLKILNIILPEFEKYKFAADNPLQRLMDETGLPLNAINYKFYNERDGYELMELLSTLSSKIKSETVLNLVDRMKPFLERCYLSRNAYALEQEPSYYLQLAEPILERFTYSSLIINEDEKEKYFELTTARGFGVILHTFHSSKGKESDDVFILDADEGILPNKSRMDKYIQAGCLYEAAVNLRNERSLLYVASTRARNNLVVQYNGEISKLLSGKSNYDYLDKVYKESHTVWDDVNSFINFSSGTLADVKLKV